MPAPRRRYCRYAAYAAYSAFFISILSNSNIHNKNKLYNINYISFIMLFGASFEPAQAGSVAEAVDTLKPC
jgi:hypothetical protein